MMVTLGESTQKIYHTPINSQRANQKHKMRKLIWMRAKPKIVRDSKKSLAESLARKSESITTPSLVLPSRVHIADGDSRSAGGFILGGA